MSCRAHIAHAHRDIDMQKNAERRCTPHDGHIVFMNAQPWLNNNAKTLLSHERNRETSS